MTWRPNSNLLIASLARIISLSSLRVSLSESFNSQDVGMNLLMIFYINARRFQLQLLVELSSSFGGCRDKLKVRQLYKNLRQSNSTYKRSQLFVLKN